MYQIALCVHELLRTHDLYENKDYFYCSIRESFCSSCHQNRSSICRSLPSISISSNYTKILLAQTLKFTYLSLNICDSSLIPFSQVLKISLKIILLYLFESFFLFLLDLFHPLIVLFLQLLQFLLLSLHLMIPVDPHNSQLLFRFEFPRFDILLLLFGVLFHLLCQFFLTLLA